MTLRTVGDQLTAATNRLALRYGHVVSPDVIRSVVDRTYRALVANATVTTYLPVLAERSAAKQLTAIAGSRTAAPAGNAHARTVALRGAAAKWRDAIETTSDGRWRCTTQPADVHVVAPGDRDWSPQDVVVVVDVRESPPPAEIADAYDHGASAYVAGANPVTVVAHLNALARRLPAYLPDETVPE